MPTPTIRKFLLVTTAVLMVAGGALLMVDETMAQCSEDQNAEAQLQFQGAQNLLQAQQWDQAISQLQSIIDFCPDFFPGLRGLGMAYEKNSQWEEAAAAYGQVIEVLGMDAEASDYGHLAKVYTRQKKYREARAEYLKAQARDARNCAVLVNLGILHNASGYPLMAVETLEDALAFCPDLSETILPRLAEACTKAAAQQKKIGNSAKADVYTAKAREYGGSAGGTSAYQMVRQRMEARDYAGAIQLCDQVLAKDPEYAIAWLTKARAADASGQRQLSIDSYAAYLKLRPDNADETAAMIIVMAEAGQCDAAIAKARKAAQKFAGLGNKALGKIQFAYGKALFCAKDYSGARARFSQAAASGDPTWTGAAREGVSACDEYISYEAAQKKKAGN